MTQTDAPPSAPKVQAPALAVLFSVVFINLVGFGLVVPLLPFFAQSLKAEAWQITLMFSIRWASSSPNPSGDGCRTGSGASRSC